VLINIHLRNELLDIRYTYNPTINRYFLGVSKKIDKPIKPRKPGKKIKKTEPKKTELTN
jgi:hypothetical protein